MTSTTVYLLYLVFALGGAGVYFLLPRSGPSKTRVGAVLGLSAIAALITLLISLVSPGGTNGLFYLFAAVAIVAASRVITHPKPVYSAVYFVLVVIAVAAMLLLLDAEFAAVALIIVYAGAIMVTYLFVIMLARQEGSPVYDRRSREPFLAVLAGFVLMAAVAGRAGDLPEASTTAAEPIRAASSSDTSEPIAQGNTAAVGAIIMTRYIVVLEIAGVLLLISMVGAIAMSRKKIPVEGTVVTPKPLGQVGREVPPW